MSIEWTIDCVNCDRGFSTTRFEATAFCGVPCRATARAVRYGRKQVSRYGEARRWSDVVLAAAVDRIPEGARFAEVERRWHAPSPERECDSEAWNDDWQEWIARHRRAAAVTVPPLGVSR